MNEDEKALLKIGMSVALKPITDIASDVLGIAGGAWLHETHLRIKRKLQEKTQQIFEQRKVESPVEPSPSILIPLLSVAQNESRDELIDLWAKLLATAMDPKRVSMYRREYVEIAARLEPIDALVIAGLGATTEQANKTRQDLAFSLKVDVNQIDVSFRNLANLNLVAPPNGLTLSAGVVYITTLGKEFLRAVG